MGRRLKITRLLDQELSSIEKYWRRLAEHERTIKEEFEKAIKQYKMLTMEDSDMRDLKDLRKNITKLKLQIPVMYKTNYESIINKYQQSNVETRTNIPIKLLKKMPRLHDILLNESVVCKTIHMRFKELRCELKLCLLCFTVFPENAIISRRLMIYWWIGEGLIPQEDDDAEDCANDFFKKLIDMDFIEPVSRSYGRYVAYCKMKPVVRAALVMIADKIKFFDFDEYGNLKDFGKLDEIESPEDMPSIYPLGELREFFYFYNDEGELISDPIEFFDSEGKQCQFAALPRDPRIEPVNYYGNRIDRTKKYYFYRKKKITTKSYKVCLMGSTLSEGIPWENLHMLFNVQAKNLEFKPEWFSRMKNVNVMFLGRWQNSAAHRIEIDEFEFEKGLDNMNHVRFFSLQGVSGISRLPDSISKLKSLLILDLRACHNLEVIPETIGSLNCLTHLDMSECYLLNRMPKEISFLESLQVLKGFLVVQSSGRDICSLEDLSKLKYLRKLHMYTLVPEFPQESHFDTLQKFEVLTKLTILWCSNELFPRTEYFRHENYKPHLTPKVRNKIRRGKNQVEGSMKRMDAIQSTTSMGSRLEKLDLRCFPLRQIPTWLSAANFTGLKKLYIRGGNFSDFSGYQNIFDWDDSGTMPNATWNVEILRLKYLDELNMEWGEVQNMFPKLISVEKVKCPRLTLFPCNEQGVWTKKGSTTI